MNWRDIGDTTRERFRATLSGTPLAAESDALYDVARGYSRLLLAQAWIESDFGASIRARATKNFLGQKTKGGGADFVSFASYVACARYWLDKLTDPNYAYARTESLEQFVHTYSPDSDNFPGQEAKYVRDILSFIVTIPKEDSSVAVPFPANVEVRLLGRGNLPLAQSDAWLTIHNTGNVVPADAEWSFFKGGGGSAGVLVHGVCDEHKIIQMTELWKQGVHAGNVQGNRTSVALEMTARRNVFNDVEHNGAKFMAMLYTRDPRLDWRGAENFRFSPERTTDHRGWAGANPACPAVLIDRHGSNDVKFMVDLAKTYMKGITPAPVPKVMPHLVGHELTKDGETFQDASGNWWIWVFRMEKPKKPVQLYEWANVDASRKGPVLPAGKSVRTYWNVAVNDPDGTPDVWFTTRLGWRGRLADLRAA